MGDRDGIITGVIAALAGSLVIAAVFGVTFTIQRVSCRRVLSGSA